MISKEYIQAWKSTAPWNYDAQVEQDLIMSRALCELYSEPKIKETLAFRGGTALQKIFFSKSTRYSEDIDLVQIPKEKIGSVGASSNDEGLKRVNVAVGMGLGGNGARDIAYINAESAAKDLKIKELELRLEKIEKALNSK
ncbi:MAG: nucleotidyl transferase AbiEii/AbiGii toxin family protein [Bdellovibrio sp.]|nr:nucleotidyl transferase AbiEii/AbiGii toxin family protein [Bdellovibrio sp.]